MNSHPATDREIYALVSRADQMVAMLDRLPPEEFAYHDEREDLRLAVSAVLRANERTPN